ncbi:MAG: hypothetical protein IKS52_01360 [Clostridia bacterium]|nr:hypothetical protein [Clostridia bacterium]
MLTKPDCGWTKFSLDGKNAYYLGYVTDVAMEWLDAAVFGLTYDNPIIVKGFCEPGWMVCAATWDECRVWFEDSIDPPDIFRMEPEAVYPVDRLAFCREMVEDITNHLSAWVDWELYDEEGEEADASRSARESALMERLTAIKTMLDEMASDEDEGEDEP